MPVSINCASSFWTQLSALARRAQIALRLLRNIARLVPFDLCRVAFAIVLHALPAV